MSYTRDGASAKWISTSSLGDTHFGTPRFVDVLSLLSVQVRGRACRESVVYMPCSCVHVFLQVSQPTITYTYFQTLHRQLNRQGFGPEDGEVELRVKVHAITDEVQSTMCTLRQARI